MQFVDIAAAGCAVIMLTMSPQRKQPRSSVVTAKPSSDELPAPAPPERQERIPLAIFFMVSAGAIFSFSSAASKLLAETYPVGEVLFSRVLVSLVLFSAFALPTAGIAVFRTRRPAVPLCEGGDAFEALAGDVDGNGFFRLGIVKALENDVDHLGLDTLDGLNSRSFGRGRHQQLASAPAL